jgi:sugar porter (SP) family MFS transporter
LGSALATDPWMFAALRFIGGLGVGASTITAPAYISEIAPAKDRGRLVALYQFNIVFGILVAFLSNYLLSGLGENAWRWMIGAEAIPAAIYCLMIFTVPRSPRWLLAYRNDRVEAAKVLRLIDPDSDPEILMDQIAADSAQADTSETIFSSKYRGPLILAFLIAFFFELAGLEESTALLSSVGIGVTNLLFTLIGLSLIDRLGRRQLMYIGSVGYIVSLSLVAIAFALEWEGMAIPIFLFMFIAAHAIGQGTVIWVFIAEIFPNHLRASGQSFGSSVHWVLAAIIPSTVPLLFTTIGTTPVFAFFAFMMFLQLLFVWRMMPETKGKSLEVSN